MSKMRKILTWALMLSLFALPVFANHEEGKLNIPAIVLDIVLIGGVVVIYLGSVFAGELKTAFNYVFIGLAIMAFNHLLETIMILRHIPIDTTETIHRMIHVFAFAFVIYGFYRVRKVIVAASKKAVADNKEAK